MWRSVLAEEGVTVDAVDRDRVLLRSETGAGVFLLREPGRPLAPSEIPGAPGEPGLLVLPRASERAIEVAAAAGWSVVTDEGGIRLRLGPTRVTRTPGRAQADEDEGSPTARRAPTAWGALTLVRRLLAGLPGTQVELAAAVGLSQPRVSRTLAQLSQEGLVERGRGRWRPCSWDALMDWWLEAYPGTGGTTSHWYSMDDPVPQARAAVGVIEQADVRVAVSGDVAADALAPWRRPSHVVLYADRGVALEAAGFVPVASGDEATLTLRVPRDEGLWLPGRWVEHDLPLADPTQIVRDVATGTGVDRSEAVAHLRASLQDRLADRWREAVSGGAGG